MKLTPYENSAYIAVGSNECNPKIQTLLALRKMQQHSCIRLHKWSSSYDSVSLLDVDENNSKQDNYQNLVARITTTLSALQLLKQLKDIENILGRKQKQQKWQSRIIDLDILMYQEQSTWVKVSSPTLTLPHPEMHLRNFVMLPLAEIAHKLTIDNISVQNRADKLGSSNLIKQDSFDDVLLNNC